MCRAIGIRNLVFALMVGFLPAFAYGQGGGDDKPRFDRIGAPAGIVKYAPGAWGIVSAQLVNPTANAVKLFTTTYVEGEPNRQYGREFWLPPNSRRSVWYPLLMPEKKEGARKSDSAEFKSLLFDRTRSEEVLLKPRTGQVLHSERVIYDESGKVTGLMSAAPTPRVHGQHDPYEEADLVLESIISLRLSARLSRQVVAMRNEALPPTVESLDALNQLILADDRVATDSAAVSAVRQWVQKGGRLWVPLDRVSQSTVEQLFGDVFSCEVVDRVGLNEFELREPPPSAPNPVARSLETTVDFLRVIPSGVEVSHEINGWPASFWLTYGRGLVLFTTLAPEGWVRPRTQKDPRPREAELVSDYIATDPFAKLGVRFFETPAAADVSNDQLAAFVSEQVGYKIVSRRTVLATLGAFCAALLVSGVWLMRKERTEALGWLGPVGAIVTAAVLVGMGTAARQAVPPTVAEIQMIDAPPGSQEANVSGLAAVYSPEPSVVSLGSVGGGLMLTTQQGTSADARRLMVWTDFDKWHYEGLKFPAGVSSASFDAVVTLDKPIQIRGTFGPKGFTGKLQSGPLKEFDDALVVTSLNRRLAATVDADGNVAADAEGVLARSEFLSTAFLTDEQQRRLAILRQLLSGGKYSKYGARPTFLAWTNPIDARFTYPSESRRVGSALAAIPVEIERPAPGTEIIVPSPFVSSRDADGPAALPGSRQTYNFRDGSWTEKPTAACTWLRFELPPQVLPIQLARANLTLQVNAPSRMMEIVGLSAGGEIVPIAKQSNPIGTFSFEITKPEVLEVDPSGGVLIGINIVDSSSGTSDSRKPGAGENFWKMEYVDLEVHGKTAP